ncbi:hypothetical protein MSG28_008030 [Choristoneura fumiferana]|uniref:Uncharacterized protein n=1 Tax=Choristoneura fumiferana TaxID=7141 RepID=A0ACC0J9T6_CHOFU|nr:hypothetical protein MSG28_008030 [Choristoneura fumiferana]
MCDNNNPSTQSIADYLAQLLKDRKQLAAFPNVFMHMERLLDEATEQSDLYLPVPESLSSSKQKGRMEAWELAAYIRR